MPICSYIQLPHIIDFGTISVGTSRTKVGTRNRTKNIVGKRGKAYIDFWNSMPICSYVI